MQVHIKDRTFCSMYSPYCGGLTVATSLVAKWIAGMSISAVALGVLGSIPSQFYFSKVSQFMCRSDDLGFFGYDHSN